MRWIVITLLVTACAVPTTEGTTTSSPAISTTSSTSQPSAGESRLPAFGRSQGTSGITLEPISQFSLRRQADSLPIDLGTDPVWSLSPDQRSLAAAVRRGGEETPFRLAIIDLELWQITHTGVTIDSPWLLRFGADGRVYWTDRSMGGRSSPFTLERYDPSTDHTEHVATVPGWMSDHLWELQVLPSGTAVAYSVPWDDQPSSGRWPTLLFLTAGRENEELELKGLEHGSRLVTTPDGEEASYGLSPSLAWDTAGGLLYLVHAERERVTEVDLERRVIAREIDLDRRMSFLERLAAWLVPPAQAKGPTPGIQRETELSPDGRRLYVTGWRADLVETAYGWEVHRSPAGLRVYDTRDFRLLADSDLPIDSLALNPDSLRLLGTGSTERQLDDGTYEFDHAGLYLLDARTLEVDWHLDDPAWQWVWIQGFDQSGRYAYLSVPGPVESLYAVDLESGRLEGERLGSFPALLPGALLVWEDFCPNCPSEADGPWPFRLPEGYGPHGKIEEGRPPAE